MRILASPFGFQRVGLVVPKYGSTAVRRNRLKRQLRELARLRLLNALPSTPESPSFDVVIRARREAYDASFAELAVEIDATSARLARGLTGAKSQDTGSQGLP